MLKDTLAQKKTTFGRYYMIELCGHLDFAFNHFHGFRGILKCLSYYIGFKFQINVVFAELLCLETWLSKPRAVAARGCARRALELAPPQFRQLLTVSSQSLLC